MFESFRHAVWGIKPPGGPTLFWTQQDWEAYEDGFRPKDYTGGRFDQEAWKAYVAAKDLEKVRAFYASFGLEYPQK